MLCTVTNYPEAIQPVNMKLLVALFSLLFALVVSKSVEVASGPSTRIFRGVQARLGDIPYQAGIIVHYARSSGVCSGALISDKHVLTAAHCWLTSDHQAVSFTIVLGSVTLNRGGTRLDTSEVVTHEDYNPALLKYDIAMVYLPRAVEFSDAIQPISLPDGGMFEESFYGETAWTSGFGINNDNDSNSDPVLRSTRVEVVANPACARLNINVATRPEVICTRGVNGESTCSGDSGGPVVILKNDKLILIGINSFGSRSCEMGKPSVYNRVTYFLDWINQRMLFHPL